LSSTASVVYVALGTSRMRAALTYSAQLAAAGDRVLLVTGSDPDWTKSGVPDGVTLRQLPGTEPRPLVKAARRMLLGRSGPLAGARLLVAGDAESAPLAAFARPRFPKLEIQLEPVPPSNRRTAEADLAVLTPWYPSPNDPFAGAFVQATTAAIAGDFERISTIHTEGWTVPVKGVTGKLLKVTLERELSRPGGGLVIEDTAEGEVTRAAFPQVSDGTRITWLDAQIARLRQVLPTGRIEAPLIHAHTGHFAGAIAATLGRKDVKIVVTEHATFLPRILKTPATRASYAKMLDRVDRMLCVGRALYETLTAAFPQHLGKIQVVPNPIDFARFVVRPEPPKEPLRLLYLGRMLPHKGVGTLVEAFARIAAEEPRATLTLVGNGLMEDELRDRIRELGLSDRVSQLPPVPPEQVAKLIHDHDVLVHASTVETFGMTIVEAVATGTPVLVARSQGPAETLEGLHGVAGVLFEVSADPDVIVTAYRRLREVWPDLDLAEARERLRARYSNEAVAEQLRQVYREVMAEPSAAAAAAVTPAAEAPAPVPVGEDRITVVAVAPNSSGAERYVRQARQRGYAVDVITTDEAGWGVRDEGVHVMGIGKQESRRFPHVLVRGVVTGFPRYALGGVRARAASLPSPTPEAWAIMGQQVHRRLSRAFYNRIYNRGYAVFRPGILWKISRRHALPEIDLDHTRQIVVDHPAGVTTAWRIGKRHPGLRITTSMNPPAEREPAEPNSAD
jgi:glycosyltransferase involved in cell wall biosynthesis